MDKKQGMFELIERQQASGLTQKVFCEEEGIGLPKFVYWKQKWLQENEESPFIQIKAPTKMEFSTIEITYPNGVSLKVNTTDFSLIQKLVNHV